MKNRQHLQLPYRDPSYIPCAVPYWGTKEFFKIGGRYSDARGHHVLPDDYLPDFDEWLPRKWQFRGNPPQPVLLPDMLPSSAWEDNLRTMLSEKEWDRLRRFCYQAAGSTCIACGSRGEPHLEAHEAWRFDEKTGVQTLRALMCLCPICHKAKHLGYANRLGILDKVLEHLKWLNDWTNAELSATLAQVEKRQEELSSRTWKLDISFLTTYGVR